MSATLKIDKSFVIVLSKLINTFVIVCLALYFSIILLFKLAIIRHTYVLIQRHDDLRSAVSSATTIKAT
jgi:hypothetical protein